MAEDQPDDRPSGLRPVPGLPADDAAAGGLAGAMLRDAEHLRTAMAAGLPGMMRAFGASPGPPG